MAGDAAAFARTGCVLKPRNSTCTANTPTHQLSDAFADVRLPRRHRTPSPRRSPGRVAPGWARPRRPPTPDPPPSRHRCCRGAAVRTLAARVVPRGARGVAGAVRPARGTGSTARAT